MLRAHRLRDAAAIADILADGWQAAYAGFMPEATLARNTDRQHRRQEIAAFLEYDFDPSTEHIIVSDDNGVDGFVHIVREDKAGLGAEAHINLLYVDPTQMGRGVGRALMAAAGLWLRPLQRGSVVLSAYALNPYHPFYARLGGELVGRGEVDVEGRRLDTVYYRWTSPSALIASAKR